MTSRLKQALGGAAALVMAGALSAPAQARDNGGAIAAGVLGGLAAGAIVGSAAANANGYYAAPAYAAPVYGAPPPAVYGGCYVTRQPVYDAYGYVAGYHRVRVCE